MPLKSMCPLQNDNSVLMFYVLIFQIRENEELTAICDELISKVGSD